MTDKKIPESPQHSPLPWRIVRLSSSSTGYGILEHDSPARIDSAIIGMMKEDAQLIVRAVNSRKVVREMARMFLLLDGPIPEGSLFAGIKEGAKLARKFQELDRE